MRVYEFQAFDSFGYEPRARDPVATPGQLVALCGLAVVALSIPAVGLALAVIRLAQAVAP